MYDEAFRGPVCAKIQGTKCDNTCDLYIDAYIHIPEGTIPVD